MHIVNPQYLVETDWLAAHLADADLRIFDCTSYLDPDPVKTYTVRNARPDWEKGHIPGADYLDLQGELSDTTSPLRFTMPTADHFAAAMSRHGVSAGVRVVLYCSDRIGWATRVWWMLRAFGFDDAVVLNGGLDKWKAEGRPLSTESPRPVPGRFVARLRPALIASKAEVVAATTDSRSCIVNALSPQQFTGEGGLHYGRPGRIPGSVNVPSQGLVDNGKVFLPPDRIAAKFKAAGVDKDRRVIAYCGGGITATVSTFVLSMLGYDNVALYDGSLSDWSSDHTLPMELGPPGR